MPAENHTRCLRDLLFGTLALGAAGAYYAAASAIPRSGLSDAIGPGGLPKAYAIVLVCLAIVLIVRSLIASRTQAGTRRRNLPPVLPRAIAMLAIGIAYVVLVARAGYIVGLGGLILASIYAQRASSGSDRGPARLHLRFRDAALVAVSGAVFFWIVFVRLLGIPQPVGFWPSLS